MAEKKTFREIAMLWEKDKRRFVKLSTMSAYSLILENHLLTFFGEKTNIAEEDVQQFIVNKLQTLSHKTVKDRLIVLKMVYRYGVKLKHFTHEEWDIKFPGNQNRPDKSLGIPSIKFHGLRHSFATRCIETDCDCKTVSAILGHANISTTLNLYVHPNLKQKQKCIKHMIQSLGK